MSASIERPVTCRGTDSGRSLVTCQWPCWISPIMQGAEGRNPGPVSKTRDSDPAKPHFGDGLGVGLRVGLGLAVAPRGSPGKADPSASLSRARESQRSL